MHVFNDFNKVFDNVEYWLLFSKWVDNDPSVLCLAATRLIAIWYSNQQVFVRWRTCHHGFLRQGGILLPFLFRFYVRDLITKIASMNIGYTL